MTTIVNPYIAGAPVDEIKMFFGREDIFSWIERSLTGQYVDNILVIHGQRRVGKTSILKQLPHRLSRRYIPVFLDLQGRTHTSLDRFLWWMGREIGRLLKKEHGIDLQTPEREALSEDPEKFETQFLPELRQAVGERVVLLTFDEFDMLDETAVKAGLGGSLVTTLRRLMGTPGLGFIFSIGSSGRKLENMKAAYTDFFKTALYKKVSFLGREDAYRLVTEPVAGILEYHPQSVERIYQITHGHPYFTQLLCHELFSRCQKSGEWTVGPADVEAVLEDVVERGTVNLKFVWDDAENLEKWAMAALAQQPQGFDAARLGQALQRCGVRFADQDLAAALLRLQEKDVLAGDNTFVVELMRIWLQKNRPLERVRDELVELNPIASRYLEIGMEHRDRGQIEPAIESFRQALKFDPANRQARLFLGEIYLEQRSYSLAAAEFEQITADGESDVAGLAGLCRAYLGLGKGAWEQGQTAGAIAWFEKVLKINPEHLEGRQHLAAIYRESAETALAQQRDDEAVLAFRQALDYTPEDAALDQAYQRAQALRLERALQRLLAQAERQRQAADWDAALAALEQAQNLAPGRPDLQARVRAIQDEQRQHRLDSFKERARTEAKAERWEQAAVAWEQALELAPDDPEATQGLAQARQLARLEQDYRAARLALKERRYNEAIRLLKGVINEDETFKDAPALLARAVEAAHRARPKLPVRGLLAGLGALLGLALVVLGVMYLPELLRNAAPPSPGSPTAPIAAAITSPDASPTIGLPPEETLDVSTSPAAVQATQAVRTSIPIVTFTSPPSPTPQNPPPTDTAATAISPTVASSPKPTATSRRGPSPTPTLDPNIQLAGWGEPMALPEAAQVISPDNAAQLSQLARWESPKMLTSVAWSAYAGGATVLAAAATAQTTIYFSDGAAPVQIDCGISADNLVFSPGGLLLPCPAGASFNLYITKTGKYSTLPENKNDAGHHATSWEFVRDDFLSATLRGNFRQWSLPDGDSVNIGRDWNLIPGATALAISSDASRLASGRDDGFVWLWDLKEHGNYLDIYLKAKLSGHSSPISRLDFSPDGDRLASGSTGRVIVWGMPDGIWLFQSEALTGTLSGLEYAPSGSILAASAPGNPILLFNAADGAILATLDSGCARVSGLAWSPDGRYLASTCLDGALTFWGLRP